MLTVDTAARAIRLDDWTAPCRIGRSGMCAARDKREGDGCTPLGRWPVRGVLLRPGTGFSIPRHLPWRWVRPNDGWSDDIADPAYNRPVVHPHPFSAEKLWKADGVYDAILILGHNDAPPIPGMGSAIFLHLIGKGDTEGCVAVSPDMMQLILETLRPADDLTIV